MRTIIDIPDEQLGPLSAVCRQQDISRAEAIRQALVMFLAQHGGEAEAAFGLWKGRSIDGVEYQRSQRQEWGGVKPVFDTNILIDFLGGVSLAKDEIDRFPGALVSTITWIEVMAGARDAADEVAVGRFLQQFEHVAVDKEIAQVSFRVRRQYRLKLPDAIIWATAKRRATLLVTRNVRDFPESEPDIRVPYRL